MNNGSETHWLPAAPDDFRQRCRALRTGMVDAGAEIKALASFSLDESKLALLGRSIQALNDKGEDLSALRSLRLGIVSNANTDLIELPLIGAAARYGLNLTVVGSSLGQGFQQALDPSSSINKAKPDVVMIAFDYHAFFDASVHALPGRNDKAEAAVKQLMQMADAFHQRCGATVIMATLAHPPGATFGHHDRRQLGTLRRTLDDINRRLVEDLKTGDMILDVADLAATVGTAAWFDTRQWHHGKLPFALTCVPLFADHVARLLAAFCGKAKKCLVLDFDNTLWGGVIGDDGIEGVELGNGSPLGEAFLDFHRCVLSLRDRGIVLAACSKNDEAVARRMLSLHPETLLREDHFSSFHCNWDDKPTNLRRIAQDLNLGLDALVLFDDSPFERDLVRTHLPEVTVVEVPSDPSLYRQTLSHAGWFEALAYSDEDRVRNDLYKENQKRELLRAETDVESYLKSLAMKLFMEPFNSTNRLRVTQLINKTNQFNLTTRRYTQHQVEETENRANGFAACFRLVDSFGDNGIISVVICDEPGEGTWAIDTWLMSCRVLNRRVEHAILNQLVMCAQKKGIRTIHGRYIASGRNDMVADFYERLGFTPAMKTGEDTWTLRVDACAPLEIPMELIGAV